jgi:hypothetical protein
VAVGHELVLGALGGAGAATSGTRDVGYVGGPQGRPPCTARAPR